MAGTRKKSTLIDYATAVTCDATDQDFRDLLRNVMERAELDDCQYDPLEQVKGGKQGMALTFFYKGSDRSYSVHLDDAALFLEATAEQLVMFFATARREARLRVS